MQNKNFFVKIVFVMNMEFLYGKIHRATVTDANLEYIGSITLDKNLMDASGILPNQKVEILDVNNGERFCTYVIEGKKDTGIVCLNGAAARKVQKGDKVIIVAYASMTLDEYKNFLPKIAHVDENNRIIHV